MATADVSGSRGDALAVDEVLALGRKVRSAANQIGRAQHAEARATLIGDHQPIRDAWLLFSVLPFLRLAMGQAMAGHPSRCVGD
jgi:hypothetical protein